MRALVEDGFIVACHDLSFEHASERARFEQENSGVIALASQDPESLINEACTQGNLDTLVSNDYVSFDRSRLTLQNADQTEIDLMLTDLIIRPMLMMKAALLPLKKNGGGTIVFVTSAVAKRPLASVPVYGAARAGATAFAEAMAKIVAKDNVMVYAIGPTFFENQPYWPPGEIEHNEELRARVNHEVPLARLGTQSEMGALISFLASRKAAFTTGQYLTFSGGNLP